MHQRPERLPSHLANIRTSRISSYYLSPHTSRMTCSWENTRSTAQLGTCRVPIILSARLKHGNSKKKLRCINICSLLPPSSTSTSLHCQHHHTHSYCSKLHSNTTLKYIDLFCSVPSAKTFSGRIQGAICTKVHTRWNRETMGNKRNDGKYHLSNEHSTL